MSFLRLSICLLAAMLALPIVPARADGLTVLHRGNGTEPGTLDPATSISLNESHIQQDLFEGLVLLDNEGHVQPGQAARWGISADGRVYTFHLRPGLKWSNGAPLTAQDFVYSLRRVVDPMVGSDYAYLLFPILNARAIIDGTQKDLSRLGVQALDAQTLVITLETPTAYFLTLLSHSKFLPVYRTGVETFGAAFTRPGNLISNGAFILKEWVPQARIVLERNPNYWDAAHVHLDRVIYLPIEDAETELRMYRAGQIDISADVPSSELDVIRRKMGDQLQQRPALGAYYYGFNLQRPPFKDAAKLRLALSMVLDREAIASKILRDGVKPSYGWTPPGIPGYPLVSVAWKDWPAARRLAEARKLYAEAGYGPDHPLITEIRYNTSENHKRIAIAIAEMWRQALGVHTTLLNEEFKVFLENRHAKRVTQVFRSGWIADYADPDSFAELFSSTAGLNDCGYRNSRYDALVAQAAADTDQTRRFATLARAETVMLADTPMIPLYNMVWTHLVKPDVHGFTPNILDDAYSKDISVGPRG